VVGVWGVGVWVERKKGGNDLGAEALHWGKEDSTKAISGEIRREGLKD